jgi:hypothetical protein
MQPHVEPDASLPTVKHLPGFAWHAAFVAALLMLASCASTPQAPPDVEQRAKEFETHPGASTIYVYRSEFDRHDQDSVLYMDGRLIGSTLPGTFFRIWAVPGRRVLHGVGSDLGSIALDTIAGELYFVSLDVTAGHSRFQIVPRTLGERRVRECCAMLENWTPGQRPLLR